MDFLKILLKEDEIILQELFYKKFLTCDKVVLLLVSFSMVIGVLEENFFFDENRELLLLPDGQYEAIFHEGHEENYMLMLRILNTLISFILDYNLILRKIFYFRFTKSQNFFGNPLALEALIEIIAIHVHSYPMLDSFYSSKTLNRVSFYYYNTTLTAIFLLIRSFFLFRSLLYFSIFSSTKSHKICLDKGVLTSLPFTLKSEFHYNTQRFAMIIITSCIGLLGFLVRMCERSFMQLGSFDWDYVWNSFWIIIVDMTAVGYGDIVPVTYFGRVIIGIAAIGSGVITSLIYLIFLQKTSFNEKEEKAYHRMKANECKRNLRNKAKKCIMLSMKFNHHRIKFKKDKTSQDYLDDYEDFLVDIKNNVKDFANLRKTITDFTFSGKINEVIFSLNEKLSADFDYMISYLSFIDYFEKKIMILIKNIDILTNFISNLEDIYSQILMSLQYLKEKVLEIFSQPNFNILDDLKTEENNYLLIDFIQSVQNSIGIFRKSITCSNVARELVEPITIDNKILKKLAKNKFISLKKIKSLLPPIHFSSLADHLFARTFLTPANSSRRKAIDGLIFSNEAKLKNIMELSKGSDSPSPNSKIKTPIKSLHYKISVISESKIQDNTSRVSFSSSETEGPRKDLPRKLSQVIKRLEKKELTSLIEEGLGLDSGSPSLNKIENTPKFNKQEMKLNPKYRNSDNVNNLREDCRKVWKNRSLSDSPKSNKNNTKTIRNKQISSFS